MYDNGKGVGQDYKEAVKLYRLSAKQGNAFGLHSLGAMYSKGTGVIQNDKEAVKYFKLAAEKGFLHSQYNLGLKYFHGQGVAQDKVLAHMWWNIAASEGYESAKKDKDKLIKEMTASQIEEAERLAREW